MDDILTREISLPDLKALTINPATITEPYAQIIDQLGLLLAEARTQRDAAIGAFSAQAEQIVALKAALTARKSLPDKLPAGNGP